MLVGTDRCKACYGVLIAHTTQANGGPFFGRFAPANQQIVSAPVKPLQGRPQPVLKGAITPLSTAITPVTHLYGHLQVVNSIYN